MPGNRWILARSGWKIWLLLLSVSLGSQVTRAQDVAETAGATASSGAMTSSAKSIGQGTAALLNKAQDATEAAATTANSGVAANAAKSATGTSATAAQPVSHLVVLPGPPVDEVNRKALEEHTGPDAGKLMLHSVPTGAQIYINGLLVGRTPLLLVVTPGKYKIEMRGQRQEYGKRSIGLLPNETQDIIVTLASLYPTRISTR
jgi:PEGA domain